jgi:hypothetical protein
MFNTSSQQNNGDKDKPIVDKTSKMKVKTSVFWLTYSHLGSLIKQYYYLKVYYYKESCFDIEFNTKLATID